MIITNSLSSKSRWKKCDHLSSFLFYSWFMVLKLLKIVHFLKICADLSKKSKSIKVINLYSSENITFYRGMGNSSRNIEESNIKKADLVETWQNSLTSNVNIFFSKRAKRELSDAYSDANCYNSLRFFADISQKITKKTQFLTIGGP